MSQLDYYQVLGVPRDAPPAAIRAAFVRSAKRHHPDHAGSMTGRLREVQQAYRCLSDPAARARHDRELAVSDRSHFESRASVLRNLDRYDRRRQRRRSKRHNRRGWLLCLAITAGVIAIGQGVVYLSG